MSISDKTRKLLWGKSGNRCAICRQELHIDSSGATETSVIGEECHIVSRRKNGPRYDSEFPQEAIDSYENLILLCRVHHKTIDDLVDDYTVTSLRQTKKQHERWVRERLGAKAPGAGAIRVRRIKTNIPSILHRLTTGKELVWILDGAMGYEFDYDEFRSEDEVELISEFVQSMQDYGDIWNDLEAGERVRVTHLLTTLVGRMEERGYFVFGDRENRIIEGGSEEPSDWPIAIIHVRHKDNPEILRVALP